MTQGAFRVDHAGRTDVPDVYAAGDAARVFNPVLGVYERSEHWEAASRQGAQVARSILGLAPVAPAPPSFWTDQYGIRVQLIGDAREADEVEIDGDPEARDFEVVMRRDGIPVAGMAVGRPRAIPRLRKLVEPAGGRVERSEDEIPTPSR